LVNSEDGTAGESAMLEGTQLTNQLEQMTDKLQQAEKYIEFQQNQIDLQQQCICGAPSQQQCVCGAPLQQHTQQSQQQQVAQTDGALALDLVDMMMLWALIVL
jgi:hypothetical protein